MTRRNGRARGGNNVEKVGYKRPPKQYQFKPGHSGNRGGRPKKQKANLANGLLSEFLGESVYEINGKRMKISHIEAVLLKLRVESLRGNVRAASEYFKFAKTFGLGSHLEKQLKSGGQTTLRIIYVDGPGVPKPVVRT